MDSRLLPSQRTRPGISLSGMWLRSGKPNGCMRLVNSPQRAYTIALAADDTQLDGVAAIKCIFLVNRLNRSTKSARFRHSFARFAAPRWHSGQGRVMPSY
jgi:hypothetical protein